MSGALTTDKNYKFETISDIKFENLSVFNKREIQCPFKFKFSFAAGERHFECYARTEIEQRIWVQTLCRIIDCNNGISPEISGFKST